MDVSRQRDRALANCWFKKSGIVVLRPSGGANTVAGRWPTHQELRFWKVR